MIALVLYFLSGCIFVGCYVSHTFAATTGIAFTVYVAWMWWRGLVGGRSSKPVQYVGIPLPQATALPTRWRDERWKTRDVRYAPDAEGNN